MRQTRKYEADEGTPAARGRLINEVVTDRQGNRLSASALLLVRPDTPISTLNDIARALERAYEHGRGDRTLDLESGEADWEREALRERLLMTVTEWGQGWAEPSGPDSTSLRVALVNVDSKDGSADFQVSEHRHDENGPRFRVRLTIDRLP